MLVISPLRDIIIISDDKSGHEAQGLCVYVVFVFNFTFVLEGPTSFEMALFTDTWWYDLISISAVLIVCATIWVKRRYSYWEKRGIVQLDPVFPFGNAKETFMKKESFADFSRRCYDFIKSKGKPHGGLYLSVFPCYMPVNLDIVKNIIQNEFQHFVSRGEYFNEESDPLSAHLFALEGTKWRNLRTKLTPAFTSGKLKMMCETVIACSNELEIEMAKHLDKESIDMKDYLSRFTMDVICSCGFGIECNSLKNPNSEFNVYGQKIMENDFIENIKGLVTFICPDLMRNLGVTVIKKDFSEFFMRAIKEIVDYREQNNLFRKDFMHLLLQLKNRGKLTDDENVVISSAEDAKAPTVLTFNELAAQCFVFFLAGFETSSTTMSFCLYELSRNEELQDKLRKEINEVLERHHGKITYDAIMEMKYMEKVINETLRMYPPVPTLTRVCNTEYKVPGTNLVIEKEMRLLIPVIAIQHDSDHYPDPEVFDPERFSEEVKATRHPFAFIPFGEGPRICIGLRFGMMQTKVGLTAMLRNFKFKVNPKTESPIKIDPKSFTLSAKGGIWLDCSKA